MGGTWSWCPRGKAGVAPANSPHRATCDLVKDQVAMKINLARVWAPTLLIKQAVRLGKRIRMGKVSPAAMTRLREAGAVRSPQRMTAGLERGNVNIARQLGVREVPAEMLKGQIPAPTSARVPVQGGSMTRIPRDEFAGSAPAPEQLSRANTLYRTHGDKLLFTVPMKDLSTHLQQQGYNPLVARMPGNVPPRQAAALFRRHELDEMRLAHPGRRWRSHHSPAVVAREGQNLMGLSPELQQWMLRLRQEAPELRRMAAQGRVREPLGAYAPGAVQPPRPFTAQELFQASRATQPKLSPAEVAAGRDLMAQLRAKWGVGRP